MSDSVRRFDMLRMHKKGDALEWARKYGYCMIHVCNAQGKMGSGIAKQVKEQFPEAYDRYMHYYENPYKGKFLGSVSTESSFSVMNMVAQEFYGSGGIQYLSYEHLQSCLDFIAEQTDLLIEFKGIHTIVVPYKMGADRAGGDWDVVLRMIYDTLGEHFNIMVVEL